MSHVLPATSVLFGALLFACNGTSSREGRTPGDSGSNMEGPAESTAEASSSNDASDCVVARATGSSPTIDGFDDASGLIPPDEQRGGRWFYYDDGTGGEQRSEVSDGALHVSSTGYSDWGSGFGTTLSRSSTMSRQCAYDAAAYRGVEFRARGTGVVVLRLATPSMTPTEIGGTCTLEGELCYDWPQAKVTLGTDWQTYSFDFCAMLAEGWSGAPQEFDATQLSAIHFRLEGGSTELWLDDLSFHTGGNAAEPDDGASARGEDCPARCPLRSAPASANLDAEFTYFTLSESLSVNVFEQETPHCGTLQRRYLSYVPNALSAPSSAPVLIALHGSSANAESMQREMSAGRFDELAERDGFIVVYGNAAPGRYTDPDPYFSNTGAWRQAYFDDGQVDDVEYLKLVLADLQRRGVTSGENSVYLTGISNGGGMVLQAAREAPELFAGIAPLMPFDGIQPAPIPDLTDTPLDRVLFGYAPGDPGMHADYTEVLSTLPRRLGTALGLSNEQLDSPIVLEHPDQIVEGKDYQGTSPAALATRDSRVTQLDHSSSSAKLRVLVFDAAGHFWPNPGGDTEAWMIERWGFRNQDIDAADAVWDFFRSE